MNVMIMLTSLSLFNQCYTPLLSQSFVCYEDLMLYDKIIDVIIYIIYSISPGYNLYLLSANLQCDEWVSAVCIDQPVT